MPKVEATAVRSETDVDTIWQVLFCLMERDVEEDGEQCGGQDASLLDAAGDGEILACEDFGECSTIHALPALFF